MNTQDGVFFVNPTEAGKIRNELAYEKRTEGYAKDQRVVSEHREDVAGKEGYAGHFTGRPPDVLSESDNERSGMEGMEGFATPPEIGVIAEILRDLRIEQALCHHPVKEKGGEYRQCKNRKSDRYGDFCRTHFEKRERDRMRKLEKALQDAL